ncbi:MAG: hypothetical protein KC619_10750 [Myxococcales bacterium]|nr:hypothetical protein [Myxococcales bacterium]
MSRRFAALAATCLIATAGTAAAQVNTADLTLSTYSGTPTPISSGVGSDFGGMIGVGPVSGVPVTLSIDSDILGDFDIAVRNIEGCMSTFSSNYDVVVVYIDSIPGAGIASTSTLNDTSSVFAAAVSGGSLPSTGAGTANVATLNFPSGFRPDYALALVMNPCDGSADAQLFPLASGTMTPSFPGHFGTGSSFFLYGLTLADLGMSQGDSFNYLATVVNARNGWRGNEFQGLAAATRTIGMGAYPMAADPPLTFSSFTTVGEVVINEVDSDTVGTDVLEFIELHGPPNLDLEGATLILYNGAGDTVYDTISLDGYTLNAAGYLVLGNSGVTPSPDIVFADNHLQNGADGVGIFFDSCGECGYDLLDAVVYGTNDPDDPGLRALLGLSTQPQVDENGRASRGGGQETDSINRCPPGSPPLTTVGWVPNPPTPGAPNDCSVCGDGSVEGPEECEPTRFTDIAGGSLTLSCCTSLCRFASPSTECRAAADLCDVAEMCTGSSETCPADRVASGTFVCRDATGPCDVAETCTGSSVTCPADGFAPTTTECRAAAGDCDAPEHCTGSNALCPLDVMMPAMTECRAAMGGCDVTEVCDGTSPTCPANGVLPAMTECRASAGDCDVAESCDGASPACPTDVFAAATTICRMATDRCDVEELCTGMAADCPMDMLAADGTRCDDGLFCNGEETCMAGACTAGTAPICDDRNVCTTDSCSGSACDFAPVAGCCNVDADCSDGDVCTADVCSGPGGTCSASPITNCCEADADCDDANSCTADACDLATNRCTRTPVAGCCATDADCDDGNACSTDACDAATGTCSNTDVVGCCLSDGDCNDDNTCTMDSCDTAAMTCTNDAIAGCCVTDADCDDGDECTTDMCDTTTATCSSDRIPGCGRDGGTGLDDGGMGGDASVDAGFDAGPLDGAVGAGGDGSVADAGEGTTEGGCGCRATRRDSPRGGLLLLLGLGAVVVWRRRR